MLVPRLKKLLLSSFLLCASLFLVIHHHRRRPLEDLPLQLPSFAPFPDSAYQPLRAPAYLVGSARPCRGIGPALLAVVHSAPTHLQHREAVRKTWGSAAQGVRTVFVVGRSSHPKIQQRVLREAQEQGDLILVDMPDTYSNLTYKHLAGLSWGLRNCPTANHILKADDDAFVDVPRALRILNSALTEDDLLACRVVPEGSRPKRTGKWALTITEYPPNAFPEYCSGLAYFAKPGALRRLLAAAESGEVPRVWIDDVFVTGLAAEHARVRRLDLGVWFAREDWEAVERLKKGGGMPWVVVEMGPRHWPEDAEAIWSLSLKKDGV